jgi:uncharacterized protein
LLLYNSFMGALARVVRQRRSTVLRAIAQGIEEDQPDDPALRMLCEHGYFVPRGLDEVDLVTQIIRQERDERGFNLILMPHENCNFRCTYCYEEFKRGKMNRDVVESLKRFVDRSVSDWEGMTVQWFGGEPLLALDLIEELSDSFMASCERHGTPYWAGITTNGYLLTSNVIRTLFDARLRRFQITLDGPEAVHNARRRLANSTGTYGRVLANLKGLRGFSEDFVIRLRVNFDPDSIDSIKRWLPRIARIFADDSRFAIDFQAVGHWGGANDDRTDVFERDAAIRARLDLFEAAFAASFARTTMQGLLSSHGCACYAGRESSVVVGADGTLYRCTIAFDDPRNHVGRITRDGRLLIDQDRWAPWARPDAPLTPKCAACWLHPACQGRTCPLTALNSGAPLCPASVAHMQELLELAAYGQRVSEPARA